MRILLLGGTGIIGQHMYLLGEYGRKMEAVFAPTRQQVDLSDKGAVDDALWSTRPEVIVNLAGESRPDAVQQFPESYEQINVMLPWRLAQYCEQYGGRLIQVSTQAVFGGKNAPYGVDYSKDPVNAYGEQKRRAENLVLNYRDVTIIRPTFVLGIRPNPNIGRANPAEQMLQGQRKQVNDRWFSPAFAPDVARVIWDAVLKKPARRIIHAGIPMRTNRYQIAKALGVSAEPVSHDSFPGIAPRPFDTTYACGDHFMSFEEGIQDCLKRWQSRNAAAA